MTPHLIWGTVGLVLILAIGLTLAAWVARQTQPREGKRDAAMSQFFIDSREDVGRCKVSLRNGSAITIYGVTGKGTLGSFRGVVQAVEERLDDKGVKRWRITMRDLQ